jgi:hypothetical protein
MYLVSGVVWSYNPKPDRKGIDAVHSLSVRVRIHLWMRREILASTRIDCADWMHPGCCFDFATMSPDQRTQARRLLISRLRCYTWRKDARY